MKDKLVWDYENVLQHVVCNVYLVIISKIDVVIVCKYYNPHTK